MKHDRMEVLAAMMDQGIIPVFYHPDPDVCLNVIRACARGGAPVVEFTNRGDFACDLFGEINRELIKTDPDVVLGIGSVLDAEGWFPTRDVAMLDDAGYLFLGGRSDDTIIRGGENIAPAEIEDVLIEHPHVSHCAVVGPEDPEWGQIIVAVVVPTPGTDPEAEDLRAYVRSQLRGSRTPDLVVFRDELPTNATGKILRRELVDEFNSDSKESA